MNILGISAYYHDSAACLLVDGQIGAAMQEERFTRKKHDSSFPKESICFCLEQAGLTLKDIDYITFYEKPLIKFERLLETYLAYAPAGIKSFLIAMPLWLKDKLFLKNTLRNEFSTLSGLNKEDLPPLLFNEHHRSHAASAFFPSPFRKAAVLCLDGVGEWATTSVWLGEGNKLIPRWEINFPHSLGLLYSSFASYAGFKVNSEEGKFMGLAPFGDPKYVELIRDNIIDLKNDGTFRLNMHYFNYATGLTMTNQNFNNLFGGPPRSFNSEITQKEKDIARSVQEITEKVILALASTVHKELDVDFLCLAGGVTLNCVANGRIQRESPFKDLYIQPAAGDAGGAIGAATSTWYEYLDQKRDVSNLKDQMQGSYLGGSFDNQEIKKFLDTIGATYVELPDSSLMPKLADILTSGHILGWFNGKMEFGPRALGGRSIIADPRNKHMQSRLNLKIKFRESFRPFAPAIKNENTSEWFEIDKESPYMLLTALVRKKYISSCEIPAVTHIDNSARIQTVDKTISPRFYDLISHFEARTSCPILINTSFNVQGEPIVYTPKDAYKCFMQTEMDFLVMENIFLDKSEQANCNKDSICGEIFSNANKSENKRKLQNLNRRSRFLFIPAVLNKVGKYVIKVAHMISWFNSQIILGVLFYIIFTPVAIFLKIIGKDSMSRSFRPEKESYRIVKKEEQSKMNFEKPY